MQLALDIGVRLIKMLRRLAQVLIDLNVSDRPYRERQRSRNKRTLTDTLTSIRPVTLMSCSNEITRYSPFQRLPGCKK